MKTTPYSYCANNPTNLINPDGERYEYRYMGAGH